MADSAGSALIGMNKKGRFEIFEIQAVLNLPKRISQGTSFSPSKAFGALEVTRKI